MIAVAIAFILIGIVFLFVVPWVGIGVGVVGLVLAIPWVAGFGRGAVEDRAAADRPRF